MIELLIIPYMALMAVWSGGSLWPSQYFKGFWTNVPEIFFALGFGLAVYLWAEPLNIEIKQSILKDGGEILYLLFPLEYIASALSAVWSYIWMQTGHANALPWGKGGHNPGETNTLSPVIKWIADRLNIVHFSTNYARLFMSVKGLLITLPVGGLLGAILWPLGYEIGSRLNNHAISEAASGAGAGICIWVFMLWL